MPSKPKQSRIDTLFVLIIFCVFAGSALASLTFGAGAYRNIVELSQDRFAERISLNYIWTKAKSADEYGRVFLDNFNGTTALVLEEDLFGSIYRTYIYYSDGWLMELFVYAGWEYDISDGVAILNLNGDFLRFEQLETGLIRVSNSVNSLMISPRSGGAG